jgi:Flp pilus assembly protein TadB
VSLLEADELDVKGQPSTAYYKSKVLTKASKVVKVLIECDPWGKSYPVEPNFVVDVVVVVVVAAAVVVVVVAVLVVVVVVVMVVVVVVAVLVVVLAAVAVQPQRQLRQKHLV